jgi:hypothetical protein
MKTTMAGVKKKKKKSPAIGRRNKTRSPHLKYLAATTVSQPQEEATTVSQPQEEATTVAQPQDEATTVSQPQEEPAATVLPTPNIQILEDDEFVYEIEEVTVDQAFASMRRDEGRRIAIYYLFTTVFGTPTNRETWYGTNGVQTSIRNRLGIPMNTSIIEVFEDILACRKNGIAFDGMIE